MDSSPNLHGQDFLCAWSANVGAPMSSLTMVLLNLSFLGDVNMLTQPHTRTHSHAVYLIDAQTSSSLTRAIT